MAYPIYKIRVKKTETVTDNLMQPVTFTKGSIGTAQVIDPNVSPTTVGSSHRSLVKFTFPGKTTVLNILTDFNDPANISYMFYPQQGRDNIFELVNIRDTSVKANTQMSSYIGEDILAKQAGNVKKFLVILFIISMIALIIWAFSKGYFNTVK